MFRPIVEFDFRKKEFNSFTLLFVLVPDKEDFRYKVNSHLPCTLWRIVFVGPMVGMW